MEVEWRQRRPSSCHLWHSLPPELWTRAVEPEVSIADCGSTEEEAHSSLPPGNQTLNRGVMIMGL